MAEERVRAARAAGICWASSLTRRRLVHTDHREATVHVASVRSLTVRDGQVPAASWASAL